MNEENPYATPKSPVESFTSEGVDTARVASGQKFLVLAFAIYLIAIPLQAAIGGAAAGLLFIALAMALVGVFRVESGRDSAGRSG